MKRSLVFLVLLAAAFSSLAHEPVSVTTVILVRHAEKGGVPTDTDPQLSAAGQARAQELARVLGSTPIAAIYTTPFHRTRQTAAPLAAALHVTPREVQTGPAYAAELVGKVRSEHRGQTVLIVGHSNSTQQVMKALGIADAPKIEESTFDNLFIVTLGGGTEPRLLALRYGAVAR